MKSLLGLLLENRSLKQTVLKNTFWLTVANIMGRTIRAALVIYAARVLGAEGYGVFSYALGFAGFFVGFSDLGINGILNRDLAQAPERRERILATALAIKMGFVIATYILVLAAIPFASIAAAKVIIPFLGLSLLLDGIREFGFSVLRAEQRMEIEAFITTAYQTIAVIFGFALLIAWKTPLALSAAYVTGSIIGVAIIAKYLYPLLIHAQENFDRLLFVPIMKSSLPFAIIAFGNTLLLYTDTLLLGWMKTEADVGYYNAATKILQFVTLFPTLVVLSLFPTIARRAKEQTAAPLTERLFAFMMLFALPIATGGVLFSTFIMTLLYGNAYAPAGPTFAVVMLLVLVSFNSNVAGYSILAHNKQGAVVKYNLFAAVFNAFLTYALIGRYGNVGAAFGTLISQSIVLFGLFFELRKLEQFSMLRHIWRSAGATGIMAGCILLFQNLAVSPFISLALSPAIYLSALAFLKEPLIREITALFIQLRSTLAQEKEDRVPDAT